MWKRTLPVIYGGKPQPYCKAALAGKFVFCSGSQGFDPQTGELVPGGIRAEAEVAIRKVAATLQEAGTSVEKMIIADYYLRRLEDWPVVQEVAKNFYDPAKFPGVICQAILTKGSLVKLAATAVLPEAGPEFLQYQVPGESQPTVVTSVVPPFLFCSTAGGRAHPGGVAGQTEAALQNIQALLEKAGTGLGRLAKLDLYLNKWADWPASLEVIRKFCDPAKVPHAITLAPLLGEARVGVLATAVLPGTEITVLEGPMPGEGRPYARGAKVGSLVFLGGWQGIDPASGKLVPGGVRAEAERALRNLHCTLEEAGIAMDNLVRMTMIIKRLEDMSKITEVRKDFYRPEEVAGILFENELSAGASIEFQALAALPSA